MIYAKNLLLFFLFSLVLLVSCKSRKPAEPIIIEHTKTVTEKVHDTIYKIEADSAFYQAFVECRNGKPQIVNNTVQEKGGKNITAQVKLENNQLTVDCNQKALEIFKTWKSQYVSELKPQIVELEVVKEVEREFSFWQKTQLWAGRIFLLLIGLSIIGFIIKLKS